MKFNWQDGDFGGLGIDNLLHGEGYNAQVFIRGDMWVWNVEAYVDGVLVSIQSAASSSKRDMAQADAEKVLVYMLH